jgi:hypothetical protein
MIEECSIGRGYRILGSDDISMGTVEYVIARRIRLRAPVCQRTGELTDLRSRYLPVSLVSVIEDDTVRLRTDSLVAERLCECIN